MPGHGGTGGRQRTRELDLDLPQGRNPVAGTAMDKARSPRSVHLRELDRMIGRAERACERYRQAATKPGLHPPSMRHKVRTLRKMEETLARLRAQQDARPP
jgi:hypothetical protein